MGLSIGVTHLGECQKVRVGGTDGLAVQEADGEAMSGRLLVVAQNVRSQEMDSTSQSVIAWELVIFSGTTDKP